MKIQLPPSIASLALLGFFLTPVNATVLVNGGLETGDFTGWTVSGAGSNVSAPGVGAQAGSFAAELSQANGVADMFQTVAASPGDVVNMSGYFLTEATLPAGSTFGLFKVVFKNIADGDIPFDAGNVLVGGYNAAFPGAESTPFLNNSSPVNTWVFSEVEVIAPAETVSVQLLALNVDFEAGGPHPMWVDGVQATVVPEPGSAAIAGFGALVLLARRRRRK